MKIGILTQPLHINYGGILQNYALQTLLKRMGHEVFTIDHSHNDSYWSWLVACVKLIVKRVIGMPYCSFPLVPYAKKKISRHTAAFIRKNICTTQKINLISRAIQKQYQFDAYVVGSDQVWRPCYNSQLLNMYLQFVQDAPVKRIAYAASFGVDHWEYTPQQTMLCRQLVQKFDLVTVREAGAVKLCEQHLDIAATHVLDPTMLLSKEDYLSLVDAKQLCHCKKEQLTVYVLDMTDEKQRIIDKVAAQLNLQVVHICNRHLPNYRHLVVPPIEAWIAGFANADFVITDSFHGTVFSIIFNKPFLTIDNTERGSARIGSLLSSFQLEDRAIGNFANDFQKVMKQTINWSNVNILLHQLRQSNLHILASNLVKL